MKVKHTISIIVSAALFLLMQSCEFKEDGKVMDTNPNEPLPNQVVPPLSIFLGTSADFVVLAGSEIVSEDSTSVTGNVGLALGNSFTGFPPGIVYGEKFINDNNGPAKEGQKDLAAALKNGSALTSSAVVTLKENLGGLTLVPGLYKSISALEISSGDLTFDAKGDSLGMFVLQIPSSLTIATNSKVYLVGGAQAKNIYWLVGTFAKLDANSLLMGNLLVEESIIMGKHAVLYGRALSKTGSVQLKSSTIIKP